MQILMSGGSGFVGTALTGLLRESGHRVSHLVRPGAPLKPSDVLWDPRAATIDPAERALPNADGHLHGKRSCVAVASTRRACSWIRS
jgi:uncharacterized protein